MRPRAVLAALAILALGGDACAPPGMASRGATTTATTATTATQPPARSARQAVESARELDQQGVRSYREARYADAIAYFRAAYALGGPTSELWNIVRCREGLDDAEGAAAAIDAYLGARDLSPQDRADGAREAQALRARPSVLTVTTEPPGATVTVDGKAAGISPVSLAVRAGTHALGVRRDGYRAVARSLEAAFGRAVIVPLDLERGGK